MNDSGDVRYVIGINRRAFWATLFLLSVLVASYCLHKTEMAERLVDRFMEKVGE